MVACDERGQATLEYAIVLLAFISMLAALSAMWHAAQRGVLLDRAVEASSHAIVDGGELGAVQDILSY